MSLPKRLRLLAASIPTQTTIEQQLLKVLMRKLESSLYALEAVSGSDCAGRCFNHLVKCLSRERHTSCFDQYEQWVERCLARHLQRGLTDAEEMMVGELLGQITGITETLLDVAGLELEESSGEDQSASGPLIQAKGDANSGQPSLARLDGKGPAEKGEAGA